MKKPTVVLVHGAFADSSSWDGVITPLLAEGFPVVAASIPMRGLKSDADYVAALIKGIDGPVVLVGHSYGGAVITNAGTSCGSVKALVYVAGFAPDTGETAADLTSRFPGSTLAPTLAPPVTLPGGGEDRLRRFKSIGLSFWRGRDVARLAHAAGIPAMAADASRQDLGDGLQPLGRGQQREVIALGPLVEVDGHVCVRARARWGQRC